MIGVIVRFPNRKYSFKTEYVCMWCKDRYWNTATEIIQRFQSIDFHNDILIADRSINKRIDVIFNNWK